MGVSLGCGFRPSTSSVDAKPPVDEGILDAAGLPTSCLDLHTKDPTQPSGSYEIDTDGSSGSAPSYLVNCDMVTEGGGWTIVFVAAVNITNGPQSYSVTNPILAGAQDTMIAYRNATGVPAVNYATFAMPVLWRSDPPFNYQANDLPVTVKVGGATAAGLLRYGYAGYANICTDGWNTASTLGRVCITETAAPYYTGFRYPAGDYCNSSNMDWQVVPCTPDRLFTIAVR